MTEERKEELLREWDLTDNMDDSEYWEWYEGLTSEEQAQIDAWEKQYLDGFNRMCKAILDAQDTIGSALEYAAASMEDFAQQAKQQ